MNNRVMTPLATVGLLTAVPTIAWTQSVIRSQELTVVEEVFEATVRVKSHAPAGAESIARLQVKGTDLSVALLEAGLAWYCRRHTGNPDMRRAETAARLEKKGIWRAPYPMPPWRHRGAANCRQDTNVPK